MTGSFLALLASAAMTCLWAILVAAPELLLRVGHLVRRRPRRDVRTVGMGSWIVPAVLLFLLFQRTTSVFVPLPPRADDARKGGLDRRVTS